MCYAPSGYEYIDINGECDDCGEPTVDGRAYEECGYSPTECKTCGFTPCDESC